MHNVYLESRVKKELDDLDKSIFDRIIREIKFLAHNPHPAGCKKIVGSKQSWRIRVGDYRVVYEIDDQQSQVRILRVRHRKEVYR